MSPEIRKISIITPCFNAEKYISETVYSVLNQHAVISGRVLLEYIVVDGASRDKTNEILKSISSPYLKVISEPDSGMYDALTKGLQIVTGDIVAYINAGDLYQPTAFDVVLDVFSRFDVRWLVGTSVFYNERSQIVKVKYPYRYLREFLKVGAYGSILPAIQQESTFWSRDLIESIDFEYLRKLRLAGDSYLWSRFATRSDLTIVDACISGFKIHAGQLSQNWREYQKEQRLFSKLGVGLRVIALVELMQWLLLPSWCKFVLSRNSRYTYSFESDVWARPKLIILGISKVLRLMK